MGDRHTGLFLLVTLSTVASVKGTADRCPSDGEWKYHSPTDTCMHLNRTKVGFHQAKRTCKTFIGGSKNNIPGHLVIILDKNTDDYVKGLLKAYSVVQALIGFSALSDPGNYTWENNSQELGNYTGWSPGQPLNEMRKASVVITDNGWKEFQVYSIAEFVCQVDAGAKLLGHSRNNTTCPSNESYTCLVNPNVEEMNVNRKQWRDESSPPSSSDTNLSIIVVPTVLSLLVSTVMVLVLLLVRRRRLREVLIMDTVETPKSPAHFTSINQDQNTYETMDCGRRPAAEVLIMDTVETPKSPAHFASINEDQSTYETMDCGRRPAGKKQNDNTHEKPNEGAVSLNLLKSEALNTAKATEQGGVYSNMTLSDETEEGRGAATSDDPTTNYDRITATDIDLNEDGIYAEIAADNVLLDSSNNETVDESDRTLYYTIN